MKKFMKIAFLVVMLILTAILNASAEEQIKVMLDGEMIDFDVQPIEVNGRTLVPMRAIFEKLGATVEWDDSTSTCIAKREETEWYYEDFEKIEEKIKLKIDDSNMYYSQTFKSSGEKYEETLVLDVAPTLHNGRTLIPLRAVSEAFDCKVGWDGKNNLISIISDYDSYAMLYAPGGRSRSFNYIEVCKQLEQGWYWDEELTYNDNHFNLDGYFYCPDCQEYVSDEINMTNEEKINAEKVEWIDNREVWYRDEDNAFVLIFSLADETQTNKIDAPAYVSIRIDNENHEEVYSATKKVDKNNFSVWSNKTGWSEYVCAVYIYDWEISGGTSKKGTISFEVTNGGYFSFDTTTLMINDNLPLLEAEIEIDDYSKILNTLTYDKIKETSIKINDVRYEIEDDDLKLYVSGEKTYDKEGNNYRRTSIINWILYDSEGYVVDNASFYTPDIKVGEKFKDQYSIIYNCIKPGEKYLLEFEYLEEEILQEEKTIIKLPSLPDTIFDYTFDDKISHSVDITNISYEIKDDDVTFYFTGEKTYDREGKEYSRSCSVGWKLYDSEGYVVDSGTFYSPGIKVNEKFRNEKAYSFGKIIPGETYKLEILNVD